MRFNAEFLNSAVYFFANTVKHELLNTKRCFEIWIYSPSVNNSLMRLGKMEKQRGEEKEADKKSKEEISCLVYKMSWNVLFCPQPKKIKPPKETKKLFTLIFLMDFSMEKITNEVHRSFERSRQGARICI